MAEAKPHIWTLSEGGTTSLGVSCAGDGLFLGPIPLLDREEGRFVVRAQEDLERLMSRGFGVDVALDRTMPGLRAVASALNDNDLCRARIAAVHLRIPDLPDPFGRLDMQLEDIALTHGRLDKTMMAADWDPAKHPRTGTVPNPGWFAPTDGGEDGVEPTLVSDKLNDDGRLHLPSGERNDEIGDLLEWIANSKPEDVPAIEGEIHRLFYVPGDSIGGSIMQRALADAAQHPDLASREKILEGYEPITHRDPQLAGEISDDVAGAALLRVPEILPVLRSILPGARTAATAAAPTAEAVEKASSEFWKLGWAARGVAIHKAMGETLPAGFPTIDAFENGVTTSIKSINLHAATYQNARNLTSTLNRYVSSLERFSGTKYGNVQITPPEITRRMLHVVVPKGSMTETQLGAISGAAQRAAERGVILVVTPF